MAVTRKPERRRAAEVKRGLGAAGGVTPHGRDETWEIPASNGGAADATRRP